MKQYQPDEAYEHNRFDAVKSAEGKQRAQAAAASRKSLESLGFVFGRSVYDDWLARLYSEGKPKGDRTGTGTLCIPGIQMRFDLEKGFPLITTKKVSLRSIIIELLWFLSGDTNNNMLKDRGVNIWTAWAKEDGDLGPIYGKQWRSWPDGNGGTIDQIDELIKTMKRDPDSRRMIINAWNVAMLKMMALTPCHAMIQFVVVDGKVCCIVTQRSADWGPGVPFNIASYSKLTHMVAQQVGLDVGELIWNGGDCHIYSNHMEAAEEQLSRKPRPFPRLIVKRKPASIFGYQLEDFELDGYDPHPPIKYPVAT